MRRSAIAILLLLTAAPAAEAVDLDPGPDLLPATPVGESEDPEPGGASGGSTSGDAGAPSEPDRPEPGGPGSEPEASDALLSAPTTGAALAVALPVAGLAALASWRTLRPGEQDDYDKGPSGPLPGEPGPERILALGKEAADRGDLSRALEWFETALASDETLTGAWVAKGLVLEEEGRPREAVEAYRRAAAQDPEDAAHQYLLARAQAQAGEPAEAARRLEALVDAFPEIGLRARQDDGFAPLHDDPRFLAALGEL